MSNPSPMRAAKSLVEQLGAEGLDGVEAAEFVEKMVGLLKRHSAAELLKVELLLDASSKATDRGKALDAAHVAVEKEAAVEATAAANVGKRSE